MTARPDEVVAWPDAFLIFHDGPAGFRVETSVPSPRMPLGKYVPESALQSANARLAAVLALADEWAEFSIVDAAFPSAMIESNYVAAAIRRAAAGEGDANQGDGE